MNAIHQIIGWILFGACALIFVSLVATIFYEQQTEASPTFHFYGEKAYANCRGMRDDAASKGFKRWICHPPQIAPSCTHVTESDSGSHYSTNK